MIEFYEKIEESIEIYHAAHEVFPTTIEVTEDEYRQYFRWIEKRLREQYDIEVKIL